MAIAHLRFGSSLLSIGIDFGLEWKGLARLRTNYNTLRRTGRGRTARSSIRSINRSFGALRSARRNIGTAGIVGRATELALPRVTVDTTIDSAIQRGGRAIASAFGQGSSAAGATISTSLGLREAEAPFVIASGALTAGAGAAKELDALQRNIVNTWLRGSIKELDEGLAIYKQLINASVAKQIGKALRSSKIWPRSSGDSRKGFYTELGRNFIDVHNSEPYAAAVNNRASYPNGRRNPNYRAAQRTITSQWQRIRAAAGAERLLAGESSE